MDDRIQYKLFNLEVAPPENAWDNIESVLNNEKAKSLIFRFNQFAVTPPPDIWEKIDKELSGKGEERGRVLSINFKKLAAAAAVIGIISMASWFFLQGGDKNSMNPAVAGTSLVVPSIPEPENQAFKPSNPNASPALQVDRITTPAPAIRLSKNNRPESEIPQIRKSYTTNDLQKKSPVENPIYINAPAILGKDGRPVIDYQLLVSNDKNYITVTSPNGQQTKISSKFLPILSYLAGHASSSFDTYQWKSKIEQWKKRLLEDPDFIPGAGNFLDLPEMTDVFEEQ